MIQLVLFSSLLHVGSFQLVEIIICVGNNFINNASLLLRSIGSYVDTALHLYASSRYCTEYFQAQSDKSALVRNSVVVREVGHIADGHA